MGVVLGGSDAYPGMNKQDIWVAVVSKGIGLISLGVSTTSAPGHGKKTSKHVHVLQAMRDERMELSPNIPEEIKELIKMMWHTDCTQRPMFPVSLEQQDYRM